MRNPINDPVIITKQGATLWYTDFHLGLDLVSSSSDTTVNAPEDGTIKFNNMLPQGGNTIHFKGISGALHRFLHLASRPDWSNGTFIKEGSPVAVMGNTGKSRGVHLHWDISKNGVLDLSDRSNFLDPETFGNVQSNWIVEPDNEQYVIGQDGKKIRIYNIETLQGLLNLGIIDGAAPVSSNGNIEDSGKEIVILDRE